MIHGIVNIAGHPGLNNPTGIPILLRFGLPLIGGKFWYLIIATVIQPCLNSNLHELIMWPSDPCRDGHQYCSIVGVNRYGPVDAGVGLHGPLNID